MKEFIETGDESSMGEMFRISRCLPVRCYNLIELEYYRVNWSERPLALTIHYDDYNIVYYFMPHENIPRKILNMLRNNH